MELGIKTTKRLRFFHLGLLILLVFLAVLGSNNIFLRGYWTTKILIWFFVFSAMILFVFGQKIVKVEKIYYGIFFGIPLILLLLLPIPFFGANTVGTVYKNIIGDKNDIKYSDSKYRLQQTFKGILAPASPPDLFVKRGLFEYREKALEIEYLGDCDSIKIDDIAERQIKITFYRCDISLNKKTQRNSS